MSQVILVYLVVPFALSWLLIKFLKAFSKNEVPAGLKEALDRTPSARGSFRLARLDHKGAQILAANLSHEEALEGAYEQLGQARTAGERASFFVVSDRNEIFRQVDA